MAETDWSPDFIGIGAMRSASSWLNRCLVAHPEIIKAKDKELHFFDKDNLFRLGKQHYRSLFQEDLKGCLTGETTPSYLYTEGVAERIHGWFPNTKLIVILRDPTERAWSHYHYAIQMQARLSLYKTFADALEADSVLIDNGRYASQLKRYLNLFPREQIKILFFEDVKGRPQETIQEVYRFLGVQDTEFQPEIATTQQNPTGDRTVTMKHPRTWRAMLRLREKIRSIPFLEERIKNTSLLPKIKKRFRSSATTKSKTLTPVKAKMTKAERQRVIEALRDEIMELESLTRRDLSTWRTV